MGLDMGKSARRRAPGCHSLRSFGFTANLLLDFPMRERILVTATGAMPSALDWIGSSLVKHFDDQMTMKTHRRMAEDRFFLMRLVNDCHVLTSCSVCRDSDPQGRQACVGQTMTPTV